MSLILCQSYFMKMSNFEFKYSDIKFCDFLNNKELLILNSKNELHVWSLETFEIIAKFNLGNYDNITNLIPAREKYLIIDINNEYVILEKVANDITKRAEGVKKENTRLFVLDIDTGDLVLVFINEKEDIEIINKNL
jgi:hypothetical protein